MADGFLDGLALRPLLVPFAVAFAVQVLAWVLLARYAPRPTPPPGLAPAQPLSVVVAARDEEQRLPALLDALAAQTHPTFEVVVVDDGSTDGTPAIVAARAEVDPRFRLVQVADPVPPRKKHALAQGIAAAQHERLVFTDADCTPPPAWLATLAAHAAEDPEAVLVGYGPYRAGPGLLNLFVRYETLLTALLTAAGVHLGRPFMAVGRNLSYPKALFERAGGFAAHLDVLSGDDDLFVQTARRAGARFRYLARPGVPSEAPPTWRRWLHQKLRHASAGRRYDRTVLAALGLFHVSALALWVAPVFLGWTGAALLAARFLVQRAALRRAAEAFEPEPEVLAAQPLLDLGYVLHQVLVAPLGGLRRPRTW